MISKSKIKQIRQLKIKKFREQYQQFIVEGSINALDYLKSDLIPTDIFILESWVKNNNIDDLPLDPIIISTKEMGQISALKNPSEILVVFEIPSLSDSSNSVKDFIIALDDIHDPGNLGTIIRTADWFGINNIVCSENSVDVYNPKVVQATMGSLSRVNVSKVSIKEFIQNLDPDVPVYGAMLQGKATTEFNNPSPGVILIGSEAHGISSELENLITDRITIPLLNKSTSSQPESLNASVACAIICYALKIRS